MTVRQVSPWKQWPSGDSRPIAVLPFGLADLSARYGLKYEEGIDDLDRYYLAAVELANGEQAWIYKHESDPNPGTVVYVDAKSDVVEAQALLADVFGLTREDLSWAAPPHRCWRDSVANPKGTSASGIHEHSLPLLTTPKSCLRGPRIRCTGSLRYDG